MQVKSYHRNLADGQKSCLVKILFTRTLLAMNRTHKSTNDNEHDEPNVRGLIIIRI